MDGIRSSSAAGGSSKLVSGIVGIVCGVEEFSEQRTSLFEAVEDHRRS